MVTVNRTLAVGGLAVGGAVLLGACSMKEPDGPRPEVVQRFDEAYAGPGSIYHDSAAIISLATHLHEKPSNDALAAYDQLGRTPVPYDASLAAAAVSADTSGTKVLDLAKDIDKAADSGWFGGPAWSDMTVMAWGAAKSGKTGSEMLDIATDLEKRSELWPSHAAFLASVATADGVSAIKAAHMFDRIDEQTKKIAVSEMALLAAGAIDAGATAEEAVDAWEAVDELPGGMAHLEHTLLAVGMLNSGETAKQLHDRFEHIYAYRNVYSADAAAMAATEAVAAAGTDGALTDMIGAWALVEEHEREEAADDD